MDDYKYEQRKHKRGLFCVFGYIDPITNVEKSCLCGCGVRTSPNKKHKTRMVKRSLKKKFRDILKDI